ncbi:hypothetical protein AAIH74_37435, partial [Pseudomonas aeruginosa]|uniref:hypothetical protein n=1 Tax=Pseudomonas aeruginosa TaxID=287 RepID=UPI0031B6D7F8
TFGIAGSGFPPEPVYRTQGLLVFSQLTIVAALKHPANQQHNNPRETNIQRDTRIRVITNQPDNKEQENQTADGRCYPTRHFKFPALYYRVDWLSP